MFDSIIIGAGPAGLSAAVYLKRANKNILIIEKEAPGGKLLKIDKVENYLGFSSIDGTSLAIKMYNQVKELKVPFEFTEVLEVKKDDNFSVITRNGIFNAKTIIYASGNQNKKPNILGFQEFENKGISYCATCDGTLYKDKDVVVLGSNEKAIEESIYLASIAKKVIIIVEDEKFTSPFMAQKLDNYKNIEILFNTKILKSTGKDKLEQIEIENTKTNNNNIITISAIFVCLGDAPSTYPLNKLKVVNDKGLIEVNQNLETSIEGLFGAGDCINKTLRQISTAVGDGALAAISALKRI